MCVCVINKPFVSFLEMEVEEIKITTKLRSIIRKGERRTLTVDDFRLRKSKTIPYRKPSAEALLQYRHGPESFGV